MTLRSALHATIIAKTPEPGHVKTRLCPPCSYEQAAAVATAGLLDTVDAIDVIPGIEAARRTLLLAGARRPWMPGHYEVAGQRGDGLGERLRNGFADLGPGVVIGMETPHAAHHLGEALAAVRAGRDVIGPAVDGGYWTIGLCASTLARLDEVFDGVPMSAASTGVAQLARLRAIAHRPPLVLPAARDLDTFDDLVAVAASGRDGRLGPLARRLVGTLRAAPPRRSREAQPTSRTGSSVERVEQLGERLDLATGGRRRNEDR